RKEYESCNAIVLLSLNQLTSAARDRGLFGFLGMDHDVFAATGKGAKSGNWSRINIGYGKRGRRFSISAPKEDGDALTPKYHVVMAEEWQANTNAGDVPYVRWEPVSLATIDGYQVSDARFEDVCALPSFQKDGCLVYGSHHDGYLRLYEPDGIGKW